MRRGSDVRRNRTGPLAHARAIRVAALVSMVAGCTVPQEPEGPAPEGTALANCARELGWRSGTGVRILQVDIFENQRGVIRGVSNIGRVRYACFTNARGEVVNITVDRPFR
jgi:hypothetical protein